MRIIITILFSLFLTSLAFTQHVHNHRCGYELYKKQLIEKHPELEQRFKSPFTRRKAALRSNEVYTLPVVLHIVYQNEDQNISKDRIDRVIENLNRDFRHLGDNIDDLRPEFDSIVGDPKIAFEVIHIERVATDTTFSINFTTGTLPDNVKGSDTGGSDAWDTDNYLNIWVCHIEDGVLLGYAYPPAGLDNWPDGVAPSDRSLDGVVLTTEIFNTDGKYAFNGDTLDVHGRALVHEVGHYLGLRHIWGDGPSTIIGIPDCEADDGVDDTPNQGLQSSFLCNDEQNTCEESGTDLYDMWENFMDYSREECQSAFTQGQIDIMRSVIENERNQLLLVSTKDIPESNIRVYPNPTDSRIYIQSDVHKKIEAKLYDSMGRICLSKTITSSEYMDISTMNPGLYHLQLSNGELNVVKSIIKI